MRLVNLLLGTIVVDIAVSLPHIEPTHLPVPERISKTTDSLQHLEAEVAANKENLVQREPKYVALNASLSHTGVEQEAQRLDQVSRTT